MASDGAGLQNPRGDQMFQVSLAFGILAFVAVPLRFLARWRSKASFAADDWFVVASLIPSFGMVAASKSLANAGLGVPMAELSTAQLSSILKTLMGTLITYTLTITLVKLSLILLYRRIFDTANFRKVSAIVGAVCIAWFIVNLPLIIFQCRPLTAFFNQNDLFSDRCIDFQAFYMGITGSNLVLDLVVLALPLYMVSGLRIATKQKILLSGIFGIGALSCIAGIMRIVTINHIQTRDVSSNLTAQYTWSQIEPTTAIICACLVTYRPLLRDLKPRFTKLFSSSSRSSSSQSYLWGELTSAEDGLAKPAPARGSRLEPRPDSEILDAKRSRESFKSFMSAYHQHVSEPPCRARVHESAELQTVTRPMNRTSLIVL